MQGKPIVIVIVNSKMNNQWNVTEGQLLPRVRGEGEAEQCHAGDEDTRDDQVEEVVESSPPHLDGEGDVHVGFRAALVHDTVPLARHSWWEAGEHSTYLDQMKSFFLFSTWPQHKNRNYLTTIFLLKK